MKNENDIREAIEEYKHSIDDYNTTLINTDYLSKNGEMAINNLIAIEQAHIDALEWVLRDE